MPVMNRFPAANLGRIMAFGLGAAFLWLTTSQPVAADNNLAGQMRAAINEVATETGKLRDVWCASVSTLPAGTTRLDVTLDKVIMGMDLRLTVLRAADGQLHAIDLWMPAEKKRLPATGKPSIAIAGNPGSEQVTGEITALVPRTFLLDATEDQLMTVKLNLTGKAGVLSGQYTSTLSNNPGKASGKLSTLNGSFALPTDFPPAIPSNAAVFDGYALALECEREACDRYEQIVRADNLARHHPTVPMPFPRPVRPSFLPMATKAKQGPPSLDAPGKGALDDLDDLGGGPSAKPPGTGSTIPDADFSKHPDAADRLRVLRDVAMHVTRMREAAQLYVTGQPMKPVEPVFPRLDDPEFGPWFGFESLPTAKDKANVLPPHQAGGTQHWQYADRWQVFGPFQIGAPATTASRMPPLFHVPGARLLADEDLIGRRPGRPPTLAVDRDKAWITWQPWPVEIGTGMLRPPPWLGRPTSGYGGVSPGADRTSWFAATEIHCDVAGEYWVAAGVDDDAQLWINDHLVAAWPALLTRSDLESPIMFRHAFSKGINRVLVRVRQHVRGDRAVEPTGFWMRVCTRGGPLSGADVQRRAEVARKSATLSAVPEHVVGWRRNGHGVWPEATPPTAWDVKQGINVRWQAGVLPMSIASPVVVGDLVLVAYSPHFLVAFDKMTGVLRWRGSLDVLELLAPDKAERSAAIWDEVIALRAAMFPRSGGVYGEQPSEVTVNGVTRSYAEAGQRIGELEKEWNTMARDPVESAGSSMGFGWSRMLGLMPSTPVTDGTHIWTWSHHGAAACFDMAGKRQWLVKLKHKTGSYDSMSSPLLVDGKLILETVPEDEKPGGYFMRSVVMVALDAASGRELWRAPVYDPGAAGSPTAMRLTNGREEMTVVITAASGTPLRLGDAKTKNSGVAVAEVAQDVEDLEAATADGSVMREVTLGGTVVRVDDGRVLIPNLSVSSSFSTPVVVGNVVYHLAPMIGSATRLIMVDRDTVGAQRLWTRGHRYGFEPGVCPVGGFLFANLSSGSSAGGQGNDDRMGYGVVRMDTGELLARHVNVSWPQYAGGNNRQYVPTAVAGNLLFCADSGEGFGGKNRDFANCTVMTVTPQPRIIAQAGLPPRASSSFAFDGDRIYYRKDNALICLGYTGDAGKAFEARENARQILDDLPARPPASGDAVVVQPFHHYPDLVDRVMMWERLSLPVYKYGPVAQDESAALLAVLGHNSTVNVPHGSMLEGVVDGKKVSLGKIGNVSLELDRLVMRHRYRVFHVGRFWDTLRIANQSGFIYFYHIMSCDRKRTVRFVVDNDQHSARMWINGTPLKAQGRYELQPGDYGVLTEMKISSPAPAQPEDAPHLYLDAYFTHSADNPLDDAKEYQATMAWAKPYLQRVVQLAPDSDEARRAREVLARQP